MIFIYPKLRILHSAHVTSSELWRQVNHPHFRLEDSGGGVNVEIQPFDQPWSPKDARHASAFYRASLEVRTWLRLFEQEHPN